MNINDIIQYIQHPDLLNNETLYDLEHLIEQYPYFQTGRLLYLHNLYILNSDKFGHELRKSAIYITDRKTIFNMIEGKNYIIKPQVHYQEKSDKKEDQEDRTLTLINSFLDEQPREDKQAIPVNIAIDYTSYLLQQPEGKIEETAQELKHQDLIDGFINQSEEVDFSKTSDVQENPSKEEENHDDLILEDSEDESYFTETLAKIYVKQHRYSKALEIIKKLNLKYPKKNAYFADQIRFLEKVIINNKQK